MFLFDAFECMFEMSLEHTPYGKKVRLGRKTCEKNVYVYF